jgi:hypothetical protein
MILNPKCSGLRQRDWLGAESNRRHGVFQTPALPTELPSRGQSLWRILLGRQVGHPIHS